MNGLTKPTTIICLVAVAIFVAMLLIFGNHEPLVPMTFEEQIKGALK